MSKAAAGPDHEHPEDFGPISLATEGPILNDAPIVSRRLVRPEMTTFHIVVQMPTIGRSLQLIAGKRRGGNASDRPVVCLSVLLPRSVRHLPDLSIWNRSGSAVASREDPNYLGSATVRLACSSLRTAVESGHAVLLSIQIGKSRSTEKKKAAVFWAHALPLRFLNPRKPLGSLSVSRTEYKVQLPWVLDIPSVRCRYLLLACFSFSAPANSDRLFSHGPTATLIAERLRESP
ncbi:hypothetical protein BJ166DRAFT_617873 [Pestalotiopsis sp. NC0098]|nr:hypothetical protein BJ166DRAFT_617873 [Pestalotiopsis sp. NC0098]